MSEEWVTMSEAAKRLGVATSQISRLAKRGELHAVDDSLNRRIKLVEMGEVTKVFRQSLFYRGKLDNQ
jgi:excisionase family DNA binding protein